MVPGNPLPYTVLDEDEIRAHDLLLQDTWTPFRDEELQYRSFAEC
jgi:hypothetical protein